MLAFNAVFILVLYPNLLGSAPCILCIYFISTVYFILRSNENFLLCSTGSMVSCAHAQNAVTSRPEWRVLCILPRQQRNAAATIEVKDTTKDENLCDLPFSEFCEYLRELWNWHRADYFSLWEMKTYAISYRCLVFLQCSGIFGQAFGSMLAQIYLVIEHSSSFGNLNLFSPSASGTSSMA